MPVFWGKLRVNLVGFGGSVVIVPTTVPLQSHLVPPEGTCEREHL